MTFSEASEREPTFEAKEEKNKEIGEIKPEGRDASETATLVNNAHNEPEVLVELEGNVEQAEAIESAVVMTVEAPVAIVDQALEAAAAKQEQSDADVAKDTGPSLETPMESEAPSDIEEEVTAKKEAARDAYDDTAAEAIDQASTTVLSAASGENAETTGPEDGGDAAIDTVPLPEQPAEMENAEAIIDPNDSGSSSDASDESDTQAESESSSWDARKIALAATTDRMSADTTGPEDGGDVAIDPVPLPEQPAKMESAEAIIDPNDSPSVTDRVDSAIADGSEYPDKMAADMAAAEEQLEDAQREALIQIVRALTSPGLQGMTPEEYAEAQAAKMGMTLEEYEEWVQAEIRKVAQAAILGMSPKEYEEYLQAKGIGKGIGKEQVDPTPPIGTSDFTRNSEPSDRAAIIDSDDDPSVISASEVIETETESVASGSRSTPEEPADDVLRGPGGQKNTGEFDDKAIDVGGIGKEAFVNPHEMIGAREVLGDLPGIGPDGIADLGIGLDLGSISGILFGASGRAPDPNDYFPEVGFGKDGDDLLGAAGSVGDPRLSTGPPIPYPNTGYPNTGGSPKGKTNKGVTSSTGDESGSQKGISSHKTGTKYSEPKLVIPTITPTPEPAPVSDTEPAPVSDTEPAPVSDTEPTPEPESTPDPEVGGSPGPVGSNAEFELRATNPFDQPVGQEGIMQPSGEGDGFDEDRTVPISLEQALNSLLDPWTNWGDDHQGPGDFVDEIKPRGVLGDPMEGDPIEPL